jgi:hypothetical protein
MEAGVNVQAVPVLPKGKNLFWMHTRHPQAGSMIDIA